MICRLERKVFHHADHGALHPRADVLHFHTQDVVVRAIQNSYGPFIQQHRVRIGRNGIVEVAARHKRDIERAAEIKVAVDTRPLVFLIVDAAEPEQVFHGTKVIVARKVVSHGNILQILVAEQLIFQRCIFFVGRHGSVSYGQHAPAFIQLRLLHEVHLAEDDHRGDREYQRRGKLECDQRFAQYFRTPSPAFAFEHLRRHERGKIKRRVATAEQRDDDHDAGQSKNEWYAEHARHAEIFVGKLVEERQHDNDQDEREQQGRHGINGRLLQELEGNVAAPAAERFAKAHFLTARSGPRRGEVHVVDRSDDKDEQAHTPEYKHRLAVAALFVHRPVELRVEVHVVETCDHAPELRPRCRERWSRTQQ